jgi:hypothetical protein
MKTTVVEAENVCGSVKKRVIRAGERGCRHKPMTRL